jgi:hypothetical protein
MSHLLAGLLAAAQLYDAANSETTFHYNGWETNPWMKPFSHGGAATMMIGMATYDAGEMLALRNSSVGHKNAYLCSMIGMHVLAIIKTNENRMRSWAGEKPVQVITIGMRF